MLEALTYSPLQRYIVIDDGVVRFRDLVQPDTIVRPDEVPPSILEGAQSGTAIQHMRRAAAAGQLSVQLVLGAHVGKSDFTELVKEHGTTLQQARVAGVELNWRRNTPPGQTIDPLELGYEYGRWKRYQKIQNAWLKAHGVLPVPCEWESGQEGPVPDAIAEFGRILRDVTIDVEFQKQNPDLRNAIRSIAFVGINFYRGWGFVVQTGAWHRALEEAGSPAVADVRPIPVIGGGGHGGVAAQFEAAGVPVEVLKVTKRRRPMSPGSEQYMQQHIDMVANARLTAEQLRVPLPF